MFICLGAWWVQDRPRRFTADLLVGLCGPTKTATSSGEAPACGLRRRGPGGGPCWVSQSPQKACCCSGSGGPAGIIVGETPLVAPISRATAPLGG